MRGYQRTVPYASACTTATSLALPSVAAVRARASSSDWPLALTAVTVRAAAASRAAVLSRVNFAVARSWAMLAPPVTRRASRPAGRGREETRAPAAAAGPAAELYRARALRRRRRRGQQKSRVVLRGEHRAQRARHVRPRFAVSGHAMKSRRSAMD